jgi:hypothetical protein
MDRRINYALAPVKTWFYLALWLLFWSHQVLEKLNLSSAFMRSYLDDLLVVPIVLPFVLAILRLLYYQKIAFLNLFMIVSFVLLLSIFFEYILPQRSALYTADSWDIVCYMIGGIVFWFYQGYLHRKQKTQLF